MTTGVANKRNWSADQVVAPSEMLAADADFEEAIQDVLQIGVGSGWYLGGTMSFTEASTPPVVNVSAFTAVTPDKSLLKSSGAIALNLTNQGDFDIGAGGLADGAAVSVGNGQEVYFLLLVRFERLNTDLRAGPPPYYFSLLRSFQVTAVAGTVVASTTGASLPNPPAGSDFLIIGDVLVKNTGSGAFVDHVEIGRRSIISKAIQSASAFDVGWPCFLRKAGFDGLGAHQNFQGDEDEFWLDLVNFTNGVEGFWGTEAPDEGGMQPDFQGFIYWTQAGSLTYEEYHNGVPSELDGGVMVQFYFVNTTNNDIAKTMNLRCDSGSFLSCMHHGGHYDPDVGWPAAALFDSLQTDYDWALTIPPGRNMIRIWVKRGTAQRLALNITTDWLNTAGLAHDPDFMRYVLSAGNYNYLLGLEEAP